MTRGDFVLAALAAGGEGASLDPFRVQKLLFLLDRAVSQKLGGPYFRFVPHISGPFDRAVQQELDRLAAAGRVRIKAADETGRGGEQYRLTRSGRTEGLAALRSTGEATARFIAECSRWLRERSVREILRGIYAKYPEMGRNSVLRGVGPSEGPGKEMARRLEWLRLDYPMGASLMGLSHPVDFEEGLSDLRSEGNGYQADAEALASDWRAVGEALETAMAEWSAVEGPSHRIP